MEEVIKSIILIVIFIQESTSTRWFENAIERIEFLGYQSEVHNVTTLDGYILTLHRILNKNGEPNSKPILLLPGITGSSDTFLLNGEENALAFDGVNRGFDVWLGNNRGSRYSLDHKYKNSSYGPYWNFSFHEMGLFDSPVFIDYILNNTGQHSLHVVGHSVGGTQIAVLLSEKPEYNHKIRSLQLIAPFFYTNYSQFDIFIAKEFGKLKLSLLDYGSFPMFPYIRSLNYLQWTLCRDAPDLCLGLMDAVFLRKSPFMNMTLVPDIVMTSPAGTSAKCILHFCQMKNRFQQYDYGEENNMKLYAQKLPPEYNISNIKVPTYLLYGGDDPLLPSEDMLSFLKDHTQTFKQITFYNNFNHFDFVWSTLVKKKVNDLIFRVAGEW